MARSPDLDFAYLGLTVGTTLQVSDTVLMHKPVRRTALHRALLSYLSGTVLVTITASPVPALLGQ